MNPKKWKELEFVKDNNTDEVTNNLDFNKYLPNSLYLGH